MSQLMIKELSKSRPWFEVQAKSGDVVDIYIYDVIGASFWDEGNSTLDLVKEIREHGKTCSGFNVRINSPGGDVFDGEAIRFALADTGKPVTAICEGVAASAACYIFASADERIMSAGGALMIHNAWTIAVGDHQVFADTISRLKKIDSRLADAYNSVMKNHSKDDILKMMDETTWFDADEAFNVGLATRVDEGLKVAACAFNLELAPGAPERFRKVSVAMDKRNREKALRDAGFSANEAKRLLAALREDEPGNNEDSELAELLKRNIEIINGGKKK